MFEGAMILLEQMCFGVCALVLVYIVLKRRTSAFVPGAIWSLLFSVGFAWAAWYCKSDNWVRNGTLFEGTTSYIIAVVGWVCFVLLFVLFGALRNLYRYRGLEASNGRVLGEMLLWACFGLTLFDLQAQYFQSELRLGLLGILSSLYILVYAVPHAVRACEYYRKRMNTRNF